MNELRIEVDSNRKDFKPGEEISGRVLWRLEQNPKEVELRLFWYTEGKGDRDVEIAESVKYDHSSAADQRSFKLLIPKFPFSFSGKLISLLWGLELVTEAPDASTRYDLTVGPEGKEIDLFRYTPPEL